MAFPYTMYLLRWPRHAAEATWSAGPRRGSHLENHEAWQWGGCRGSLKYSSRFIKEFLHWLWSEALQTQVDLHSNLVDIKASGHRWGCRGRESGSWPGAGAGERGFGGERVWGNWERLMGRGRQLGGGGKPLLLCLISSHVVPARVPEASCLWEK